MSACSGLCVTAADIGVGGQEIAYPHPTCLKHGDPHPFKDSGKTHETHGGLMRLCVCGAYEDEHKQCGTEITCAGCDSAAGLCTCCDTCGSPWCDWLGEHPAVTAR